MSNYCKVALEHPLHGHYHDTEYGFPITGEAELFERLVMEIFQAGLSWLLILKKRGALKLSFQNFDVTKVANFNDKDVKRLLENHLIIRNRKKIEATIFNAKRLIELRKTDDGFANWIKKHHPLVREEWIKLFKMNFKFTGEQIVGEFLQSVGYLPGAHNIDCPVYERIEILNPPWKKNISSDGIAI